MVALRKDVKVGLIVGGITLAVVAVYVGLSALSGKPEAPGGTDTSIVETAKSAQPTEAAPSVAKADPKPAAPTTPVASATPTTPAAAPQPSKPSGNDDVWANAFTNGSVQPAVTQAPSLSNPSREPAAKPNEVIRALTNPSAPTQSASTADASPSLAANTPSAQLTRGAAATQPTPTAGGTTHVVKPGETFSSIAAEHYGDSSLWSVIAKANPTVDSGKMKPGVTLNLPARDKAAKPAAAAPAAAPANVDPARQYVVKPGDSLEGIASALYGERSKWQSIYDANKGVIGDSPARLKVGTVLTLPAAPTKK